MVETKDTMTPASLPDGARPEEFLADRALAAYYRRILKALDKEDPGYAAAREDYVRARQAAASLPMVDDDID